MTILIKIKEVLKNKAAMNAVCIGSLCSLSYLAVYFARNLLSAVAPHLGKGEEFIGNLSSVYFGVYAVGQLINGYLGNKIKSKYMIFIGLFMAGLANLLFPILLPKTELGVIISYGMTGFFLSMIYGPMTKIVAENNDLIYATRCAIGYQFASFIGAPMAGMLAGFMVWQGVFYSCSSFLIGMAVVFFIVCTTYERKGIVSYNKYKEQKEEKKGGIGLLIKRGIIKFTIISVITGVIRTTVMFWMPTYFTGYLGFTAEVSSRIFALTSFIISFTTFISIFTYECLKRNMDLTLLVMFTTSATFFLLLYLVKSPYINIVIMVIAIMASSGAATMLWSRYCPSLSDTGMVSGATGYLDFISYMSAAASSKLFSNAVSSIGWGNLILIWAGLMIIGIIISLPYGKLKKA